MTDIDGAPRLRVAALDLFERPVPFRIPFKFGATLVTETPQAFVRATIELADGRSATGWSAELMVPKWFDKRPGLTNAQNVDQLRGALIDAQSCYPAAGSDTAFGLSCACLPFLLQRGASRGDPPLVTNFGPALADRAVLDALCRLLTTDAFSLLGANVAGFDPGRWDPALASFKTGAFLASRQPLQTVIARHTIGMTDPLTEADLAGQHYPRDGLPVTLEQVIARYGVDHFKIKVRGDIDADLDRLRSIAAVIDRVPGDYRVTLDGNEQFPTPETVHALIEAIGAAPELRRLADAILYVEQPLHRDVTLEVPIPVLPGGLPVIIDEADGPLDALPRAVRLGYRGVSSKACKGVYRSLLNACRVAASDGPLVHSGEDLTCQPGLAVQHDLAIVAFLGLGHVERNGHHFGSGMAGVPPQEIQAFLSAHGSLYQAKNKRVDLRIADGRIDLSSLACIGFGAEPQPTAEAMAPMPVPA